MDNGFRWSILIAVLERTGRLLPVVRAIGLRGCCRAVSARIELNLEADFRPPGEDCRALVARIVASREFQRASRLRAFLAYVVDRKLAECPDEITEVLIGHRVFELPIDYNPGDNSIVRTQARTLRDRLERYFRGEGAHEPVVLEIPRGKYVPVFRLRDPIARETPIPQHGTATVRERRLQGTRPLNRRQWLWLGASAAGLSGIALIRSLRTTPTVNAPGSAAPGRVRLESSDRRLVQAFDHAKERAMECVYGGDPIGQWYASDPNSRTFCMRDVSHESLGAAVLGLTRHTENMLRRFAHSVASSRKWCGFWTITKDGFPSPDTYRDDTDFGYCLPANFDLLRACYQQLRWTGDRAYLDAVFSSFYDHSVTSYVDIWDKERSGWMKAKADAHRVHASYNQRPPQFTTSADLIAAQYAAYLAYAGIQDLKGERGSLSRRMAEEYRAKAAALKARFNSEWWNADQSRFYSGILPDGSFSTEYVDQSNVYALWFGLPAAGPKIEASLDQMERNRPHYDSTYSYFPEVFARYGRNDRAYKSILEIADPHSSSYARGETAFAALGAMAAGAMGIDPDVPNRVIETLPRLANEVEWVRLSRMPVGPNEITVEHRGTRTTIFTNQGGPPVEWRPNFQWNGKRVAMAAVTVRGGETRTAKLS
jgi:hypothetical protein